MKWSSCATQAILAIVLVALTLVPLSPPAAALPDPNPCFSAGRITPGGGDLSGRIEEFKATSDGRHVVYRLAESNGGTWIESVVRFDRVANTSTRVDVAFDGGTPNGKVWGLSVASGGDHVAFLSDATNLVEDDTNGITDAFVRDLSNGVTERVSVGEAGATGAPWVFGNTSLTRPTDVSGDGRHVVFTTDAALVVDDTDARSDVYVRDRETRTTVLASADMAFPGTDVPRAYDGAISRDGRYVVFLGSPGSSVYEVFRHDLVSGTTSLVSDDGAFGSAAVSGPGPALSDDGRFVAFASSKRLTSVPVDGGADVFVRDMESASFTHLEYPTAPEASGVIQVDASASTVAYPDSSDPRVVVHHHGGPGRVILDDQGQPAALAGGGAVLLSDGTEVLYATNVVVPDPGGGSPSYVVKAWRTLVDRASFERLGFDDIRQGETVGTSIRSYNVSPETDIAVGPGLDLSIDTASPSPHTATVAADNWAPIGYRHFTVTSSSGCVTRGTGIAVYGNAPRIERIWTTRLRPNQTLDIEISGLNLDCPCQVSFSNGITLNSMYETGDALIVASITTIFTTDGVTDVTVTNKFGKTDTIPDAIALHTTEGEFHPLVPSRILDTREGVGGPQSPIGQVPRTVLVAGRGGVPAGGQASAVVMNVTVTAPSQAAYVTVWPAGSPLPTASNLNFAAGQTVPNQVTVPLGVGGEVSVYVSAGTAQVLFDVAGYYGTASASAGGRFLPIRPERIVDTRSGSALGPGQTARISFDQAPVDAVVLNVTVTRPTRAGYLTVSPAGSRPLVSSLNFVPDQTVANLVTVGVSKPFAEVDIYNSTGSTHVIIDVVGLYGQTSSYTSDAAFRPMAPTRILDTRQGIGTPAAKLGPSGGLELEVAGRAGVPDTASAVAGNVTTTNPTAGSYLTVWPDGYNRPVASTLNFGPGQTIANAMVMSTGRSGNIGIFNDSGSTDVIADISGWFTAVYLESSGNLALGGDKHGTSLDRSTPADSGCIRCILPIPETRWSLT